MLKNKKIIIHGLLRVTHLKVGGLSFKNRPKLPNFWTFDYAKKRKNIIIIGYTNY